MSTKMIVTPWEVSGKIDYEKLIKEFGVKHIDESLHRRLVALAGEDHHFLRRKLFFAHTNLDKILDALENKQPVWLYTGRAPSGPTHVGHLIPWIFVKWLQDHLDLKLIFQIPDEEKFLFKEDMTIEESEKWLGENLLDIVAMGFDLEKTKIVIDTKDASLMYPIAVRVAKKTTASTAKALFGLKNEDNVGKYFYTCMQSVPAFLPTEIEGQKTQVLIPCAIDQDVHFRLTRDVAQKLGYPKPSTILCRFLPALASDSKMSSSADTSLWTTDNAATIQKKINRYAFSGGKDTLEEHRKHGGDPDVDISFQYLTFFEPDDDKLAEIRKQDEEGKLLSGEMKKLAADAISTFLDDHQRRRAQAKAAVQRILAR